MDRVARETHRRFSAKVGAVTREAADILSIELTDPDGALLPPFTAGAHIEFHLGNNLIRQYSLCNSPAERHRYVVGVLEQKDGRGGSRAMHRLRTGDSVEITEPRNNFPLAGREANSHLLLAGGIGVTPMMAMLAELESRAADFRLHYCTRSPAHTAFNDRLRPLIEQGKVVVHHDGGEPARGLDIAATLAEPVPAQHVYICGPQGFIAAARASIGAWPPHAVHFEHFDAVPLTAEESAWDKVPFKVKIKRTGELIDVPSNCSVVRALRAHGIDIETSCEDGYCGTCITRYVEGEPVHRDTVLSQEERKSYVMVCRDRSRSPILVLDA
jgi:vanillate O-demethylase ferredoxin subunit